MTDWYTFWTFVGQVSIIVIIVLIIWAVVIEIHKSSKKDK